METERQGLRPRPSVPGWCPSVAAVLGQDWWPGQFIYRGDTFVGRDGVERQVLKALCPRCGKWVPVHDGDLVAHNVPGGSDMNRWERMEQAREAYGRVAAWRIVDRDAAPVGAVA